ncbi:hypothetical protein KKF34_13110 [Myxococcota bacterium]|nr:hypothetical protein [Myxococcota bacterium]MBU1497807.1 hypothetical protein [Myxococcota bacterium]
MDNQKKNDPTFFEYLIVYVVLTAVFFGVYKAVLKPRGYTPGKLYSLVTGQNKNSKKTVPVKSVSQMKSDTNDMKVNTEVKPVEMKPVLKKPTPMSMELSEDDD